MTTMLVPDDLPSWLLTPPTVSHRYPEHWDEAERDQHRYDECPCAPVMSQEFSPCGHNHGGYRWLVEHRRIPRTESIK